MNTQYHLPINQRNSPALDSRLLFLVNATEFYGRRVDQNDRKEARTILETLKTRGVTSKYALRVKNILKVSI